ncbi:hypothetical protein OSB04_006092 [Centaurea solstitialis]|uniref:non-specific serine/threonine protein kinase n=1 Tax=Centaurea solstitialis TaxID=347529 RepID=A0AA38WH42_9ASTR|nr:hypothetical protein OSB04_006092 [Centaurea solstitialis]
MATYDVGKLEKSKVPLKNESGNLEYPSRVIHVSRVGIFEDQRFPLRMMGALKEIGRKLGKHWNFNEDPCMSGEWAIKSNNKTNVNNVTCASRGINCNIVSISLKGQSLQGILPPELVKLRYLENITVEDNMMSGRIPEELGNMSSIERLFLNGNYFTRELPTSFANLINLTDLHDLRLEFVENRGCSIMVAECVQGIGVLEEWRGSGHGVAENDFSFNKLNGSIPEGFEGLLKADFIYLTGNLLSGNVPSWILVSANYIDLSYNKFTFERSQEVSCQSQKQTCLLPIQRITRHSNILVGFPSLSLLDVLMHRLPISTFGSDITSLYINCGGEQQSPEDGKKTYEADLAPGSASGFVSVENRRGFSNTGDFDDRISDSYIKRNRSRVLGSNPELYSNARASALSLTYYGFCMHKGSYNVSLHFAEIVFTNDETLRYAILGRRVFDIYIQGNLVEKDFDISHKAGTTNIPSKGNYGPLISAISVDPKLSGVTCSFTLRQIKAATNNFDVANKIGEGGFGSVYKGVLPDGTLIAVKQLSSKSRQGNREFLNELGMISALKHSHLVKLHGCCIEGNQLLLAYEYMENNSLARALFGPEEWQLELDWPTRYRICIGIARGLSFLHEESRLKIVHRDIKATNVLLDKDLNAKISDFGLAKLDEEDNTHIRTRIAGTYGYMAPEYALHGYLTDKADLYSYGIVLLEIVSGTANTVDRTKENQFILLDRAVALKNEGNLMELVDPRLGPQCQQSLACSKEEYIVPQEVAVEQSVPMPEVDHEKMMKQLAAMDKSEIKKVSIPYTDSSTSAPDLYPVDGFSE